MSRSRIYTYIFIVSLVTMSHSLFCSLLPAYDRNCRSMHCHKADIDPIKREDHKEYFNKPVPRIIHQIWFGDQNAQGKKKTINWIRYADTFRYEYNLWTEASLDFLETLMPKENYLYLQTMLHNRQYCAASDIVRVELLKIFGGIYIDCDFTPPISNNEFVDFKDITTMKGITFVTEHHARNIGTENAIFVMNGIILSCALHPIMRAMSEQISGNIKYWHRRKRNYDAQYATGPFLLNSVMNGCYNVMPVTYIESLKMDIKD